MTLAGIISSKISRVAVGVATFATAAVIAFGGLAPVGAQAAGTYQCGTYGGGNYDQTDCSDAPTTTPPTTTPPTTTPPTTTNPSQPSGSAPTTTPSNDSQIVLNNFSDYTGTNGKELTSKTGDAIYFNLCGEKHTITIKAFTKTSLIVTIASTPTDVTIPYGQTVNYDVDKDGKPDIAINYNSIAGDSSTATAVYRSLAAADDTTTTPSTSTGSSSDSSTGGTTSTEQSSPSMWWVWLIPVVLGVGLLIWAIVAAKKRKAAANGGNGTNFNQF